MTANRKETLIQLAILATFVALFYGIFFLLQNKTIYDNTLGRITTTYQKQEGDWNVADVKMPYKKIRESNLIVWDVAHYYYLKTHNPGEPDIKSSYGFFPMYPWIWRITGLPVEYMGIFNFLLFGLALMIVTKLFLNKNDFSLRDRLLVFTLALSVPSVIIYLIPYSEAVFTITFITAILGLAKKQYWVYFLFMTAAAMTRPSVTIVILSLLVTDVVFMIRYGHFTHFLKESVLRILPLAAGLMMVFTYHYIYSGNFFKYYEVQSTFWTNNLQWPTHLNDWSKEGFGMNIAAITLLVIPAIVLFFVLFPLKRSHRQNVPPPSVFKGNTDEIKDYFLLNSLVFFTGFFLYILMFRGGSIHCLHRFIISSPYFLIFFTALAGMLPSFPRQKVLYVMVPALIAGYLLVRLHPIDAKLSFKDSGFILYALICFFLVWFRDIKPGYRAVITAVIAFYAIVWFTFLYNQYISCAWIFA